MYKTSVYTLVNGNIKNLHIKNSKKLQKVILLASHWLCVNVLLNIITFCNFCLSKFCFRCNEGPLEVKFDWQHSLAHPRKLPYRHKKLADIFYTTRVIAKFVANFVAMATEVGRRKMRFAAFDGPCPDISYTSRVIAHFVPNFVAMATRRVDPGNN